MAMIYVIVSVVAMLGFCSLAVDLGRVVVAKTQLRVAADAAARAAVAALPQGNSAAISAAQTMAASNKSDGYAVTLASSDVIVGTWTINASTHAGTFSSGGTANGTTIFQAVKVTARRTAATNTAIPLLFASVLGAHTCDVTATSTAALVAVQQHTQFISAQSDLWLSGEPKGTLGSQPDGGYSSAAHPYKNDIAGDPNIAYGQPGGPGSAVGYKVASTDYNNEQLYNSILQFQLTVTPGSVIQLSNVSGLANNQGEFTGGTGSTNADGFDSGSDTLISDDQANPSLSPGTTTTSGSEHGISNIIIPLNAMMGVFLDNNPADDSSDHNYSTAPTGLDFSTQTARDYTTLDPTLAQSFYVGNGQTSSDVQQTIVVPSNATRLYLGTMDGHEWSNNVGGFTATITQYQIATVQ
jgi:Flp pilus assembly protein TadG